VVEHDLQPGDRLGTEVELAAEFGVSRPTLREALRLLSGSHLIRASRGPGGGIFVARTPNEGISRGLSEAISTMLATASVSLDQLLEARILLEVPLAGLAAQNAEERIIANLEAAIVEAEGSHPAEEGFRLADARFHRTIAEGAGNELLTAFAGWTLDVLLPSVVERIGLRLDSADIIQQHRAILRGIRRGCPTEAQNAMRRHLQHVRAVLAAVDQERVIGERRA
jgi:DNA-binding FadR family transcriptional regulator